MIKQTLIRGLKITIPLLLTFLLIVWTAQMIEGIFSGFLKPILPFYFPGLGALFGLGLVFLVGLLINAWIVQVIWEWTERMIEKIPLVKTVYVSLTEMVAMVDQTKSRLGTPVMVTIEGMKLIGFITTESLNELNEISIASDDIAVYLPMSYQIGGYTVLLPRSRVVLLKMSTQETMKFVLTGGVTYAPKEHRDE